jgi:hypothetical protein
MIQPDLGQSQQKISIVPLEFSRTCCLHLQDIVFFRDQSVQDRCQEDGEQKTR